MQAALLPLLVSEAMEAHEQDNQGMDDEVLLVKAYNPYGSFEGQLRDVGPAKPRVGA